MELSLQCEKEVASSPKRKQVLGMSVLGRKLQAVQLFNILLLALLLLLAFLPISTARQRGSSPVVRHVS